MSKGKKLCVWIAAFMAITVVIVLSVAGYFFSDVLIEEYSTIEAKKLQQKNPTTYAFDGDLENVRKKIAAATAFPNDEIPFPFKTSTQFNAGFYVCEVTEEICLTSNEEQFKEIFLKPENKNDIFLASDGSRIISPVYSAAEKKLGFRTDFHIHLEAQNGSKTIVTISPVNPMVFKGYGGLGLHGKILKKEFPVEPTTIEEYQLLRYIGLVLGEKDMPKVLLP